MQFHLETPWSSKHRNTRPTTQNSQIKASRVSTLLAASSTSSNGLSKFQRKAKTVFAEKKAPTSASYQNHAIETCPQTEQARFLDVLDEPTEIDADKANQEEAGAMILSTGIPYSAVNDTYVPQYRKTVDVDANFSLSYDMKENSKLQSVMISSRPDSSDLACKINGWLIRAGFEQPLLSELTTLQGTAPKAPTFEPDQLLSEVTSSEGDIDGVFDPDNREIRLAVADEEGVTDRNSCHSDDDYEAEDLVMIRNQDKQPVYITAQELYLVVLTELLGLRDLLASEYYG